MKITTKSMILTAFFAGLTAVGSVLLKIPVGPVPITLQVFFTALSGIILGSKLGALSQIVYVAMGLIGLPVFAGGVGGVSHIFSPTFGYLLGFIVGAYIIGMISEKQNSNSFLNLFTATLVGLFAIYAVGFPYLYIVLTRVNNLDVTFYGVLKSGVLIFIPGDLVKCLLAAILGVQVIPILKKEMLKN